MRQVRSPNLQLDRAIYYHMLQNEQVGLAGPLVSAMSKIPDSEQQHFYCMLFKAHRLQQTFISLRSAWLYLHTAVRKPPPGPLIPTPCKSFQHF